MAGTGKSFQDRQRSANIRNIALDHLEKILSSKFKDKKYQREILLRLAPNLLPRLNAGRDDNEPLFYEPIYGGRSVKGTIENLTIIPVPRYDGNSEGIPTE